jgi:hypothetical protein
MHIENFALVNLLLLQEFEIIRKRIISYLHAYN